jgi:hypothetical protein
MFLSTASSPTAGGSTTISLNSLHRPSSTEAIDKYTHAEEAPENKLHHTKRKFKLLQWSTPMLLSSIQTQTQTPAKISRDK